ncbi:hypothetical protein D3C86_1385100 [compost metagenome]
MPGHQGFEVGRLDQAQLRLDHPELTADPGDALRHFGNPRGQQHRLQVLAEINILHLADIQPLETNRSAGTQAISAIELERDDFALLRSVFMVREQTETWNTLLQRGVVLRGLEGNAAGHQALQ